jgi:6-phosphogluconolactonase (cycloisomerase 2 family)
VTHSTNCRPSRRVLALGLASLVSLCGCGSQDGGSTATTTTTSSQPGAFAYAYVASAAADSTAAGAVYEYAIHADNSIVPLGQVAAGVYPAAVAMTQSYVYVVNTGDGTISQYSVGLGDTLTPIYPGTVPNPGMHTLGQARASATVDVTESFLYVANSADNTISSFSIGFGGGLTPLTSLTVATGVDPVSIARVDLPNGEAGIYVVNSGAPGTTGTVALYTEGQNGALTLSDSLTITAGTNPSAIAINDTSATVYVASSCNGAPCTGAVSEFAIGDDGTLTDTGVVASTGSHYDAVDIVITSDSSNAYVAGNTAGADNNAGALWQYGIASAGELTAVNPPTLEIGPATIVRAVYNGSLYVLTTNSGAGANLNFYTSGSSGAATLAASAKLDAPSPVTMGILIPLAP